MNGDKNQDPIMSSDKGRQCVSETEPSRGQSKSGFSDSLGHVETKGSLGDHNMAGLEAGSFPFSKPSANTTGLPISKYIPVGCLRIQGKNEATHSDYWTKFKTRWHVLQHNADTAYSNDARYLSMVLQHKLLMEPDMLPTVELFDARWIKMEAKGCGPDWCLVRVYVLPGDIARAEVDRTKFSLRKALTNLLGVLNVSEATWNGLWLEDDQATGLSSPKAVSGNLEPSLLRLFNTLPSPDPQPEKVQDVYVQDAMHRILENKVEGLSTTLYTYQQRSAALMLQREIAPAQLIDPRLSVLTDQHSRKYYCDLSTGTILREPKFYEAARGGICAETMGLGKTIICLAVILASKEVSSKIPGEVLGHLPIREKGGSLLQMVASNIGQNSLPWRHWLKRMESDGFEYKNIRTVLESSPEHYLLEPPVPRRTSRNPAASIPRKIYLSSTTIVVVPPNLIQQWLKEIEKHTTRGSLNLLLMDDGKQNLPVAEKLLEYDIILFSKPRFEYEARDERLSDEFTKGKRRTADLDNYLGDRYFSPLKNILFKRLIIDEGHAFGNANKSTKSEATTVVDFLNLSARWIVSGTPTTGLYGLDIETKKSSRSKTKVAKRSSTSMPLDTGNPNTPGLSGLPSDADRSPNESQMAKMFAQERKDIEKLGNIATSFLKVRPWANSQEDSDSASWSQYVMQPRHGSKGQGNPDCLRTTLEGMIIRHRPEDVIKDVKIPPLHHKFVYLEGSLQNKLSLNTFCMMIITNAVTSERKDADYFFDKRQRKNLQQLVSNLRQGSFFWSGFEPDHIRSTVKNAKYFLEEKKVPVTHEDEVLLLEAIRIGEIVLGNEISQLILKTHEMPMFVDNEWEEEIREAWALDGDDRNPTLMGATLVHNAQKFVEVQAHKRDPCEGLIEAGTKSMRAAFDVQYTQPTIAPVQPRRIKTNLKRLRAPELAGGVAIGDGSSPRKRSRASVTASRQSKVSSEMLVDITASSSSNVQPPDTNTSNGEVSGPITIQLKSALKSTPKSSLKQTASENIAGTLDPNSSLASATIISTASVKLSYLMSRISLYHATEKILVFYESDNVAYYIAQALECLGIKHLIYAKSLHSARRAKYVVTFNTTETFRVLLMDVSQAAFGLDLSSASRVFFVNPVFSPQVEAQAVKRAHRIGQTRPVYVETLVLRGSIEEVMLERRKDMSEAEHQKCTNILDDETLYEWIKNIRFLDVPSDSLPGPQQMARLETPQLLFRSGGSVIGEVGADPDEDLVGGMGSGSLQPENKGKKRVKVVFLDDAGDGGDS